MASSALRFFDRVSIEPTVFIAQFTHEVFSFVNQNLYFQKFCRNNTHSAPDLSTPCDDPDRGTAGLLTYHNVFVQPVLLVSLVLSFYASSYSDKMGGKRKLFIALASVSTILRSFSAMVQTFFWHWPPLLGIVLNSVLNEIGGGLLCLGMFVRAFIFDTTSNEDRITKMTTVYAVQTVGIFLGKACSGYLLYTCGFLITLFLCLVCQVLGLMSTLAFVREEVTPEQASAEVNWRELSNPLEIFTMLRVILVPKRSKKVISTIWMLLLIYILIIFTSGGESSILYLYTRQRFHWDEKSFSTFDSYRILSPLTGNILSSLFLKKWMKTRECVIGIIATFGDTLAVVGYYFATRRWHMFVVPLFDMFQGVAGLIATTLISLFFTEKEFGRMNMVLIAITVLTSMAGVSTYSVIFNSLSKTHPNGFFLLSILLNAVTCVFYGACFHMTFRKRRPVKTEGEVSHQRSEEDGQRSEGDGAREE